MKLFAATGPGRYLPAQVEAAPDDTIGAYAVDRGDGVIAVTLINRDTKDGAEIRVALPSAKAVKKARVLKLLAKSNDIAAQSREVTLNDAGIDDGGNWNGKWVALRRPAIAGATVTVTLAPASAAVVEISTAHPGR
jgi:hypothetical protein